jgi:pimeloyl-ACP methyl ester carboxylesterase
MPTLDLASARATAGVKTVRLSDGETAYAIHGERGPWVVLVHGLVTPMYAWAPMADALAAAGFRVLRYDQLGRGLSDRPDVTYALPLYVRQLRELLAALDIAHAHVVSWSMGCVIAGHLALEEPARVDRLVMIAPGLFLEEPRVLTILRHLPFARRIVAAQARRFLDALIAEHVTRPADFRAYRDEMQEQLRYPGFARSFASTVTHYPWRAGPELRPVGAHPRRVMLLWGDDDPATPYGNAALVREIYPRAELVTFAGARHAPHVEHAARANAAVRDFLAAA